MKKPEIDWKRTDILIQLALEEDLGDLGDTTTNSVIPADLKTTAVLIAKEDLICAGLPVAERLFHTLDPDVVFTAKVQEGEACSRGTVMPQRYLPFRPSPSIFQGRWSDNEFPDGGDFHPVQVERLRVWTLPDPQPSFHRRQNRLTLV